MTHLILGVVGMPLLLIALVALLGGGGATIVMVLLTIGYYLLRTKGTST